MVSVKKIFSLIVLSLVMVLVGANFSYATSEIAIFNTLADDTTSFAVKFRNFAYVISGFGIIMFTFLAIGGKINFKHLGYIVICLFMLSAVGSIIAYITNGGSEREIKLEGASAFGTQYTKAGNGKFEGNSSL